MGIDHYATDVVHYHSRRRPDAPAIEDISTGEVMTWRAFEGKVAALAGALADDLGVGQGDRVAVLGDNHPWMLVIQFACLSITPGYWRRDTDEDEAFHGEWFRTGDALIQDEDGFLTIVDRFKDMYKSGGENVYPAEVERILHEHPDIADAAVIPVVDARWGEVGRALLVPRPGVELDHAAIAEHCRARLAKYKVPAEFLTVEPFEPNVTGKIPKADLKKKYGSGVSTVAPTGPAGQ